MAEHDPRRDADETAPAEHAPPGEPRPGETTVGPPDGPDLDPDSTD